MQLVITVGLHVTGQVSFRDMNTIKTGVIIVVVLMQRGQLHCQT